jgi:periplasmic divalent cation tolerance protein
MVMTTTASQDQAEKIAKVVLEARLAACVQIQEITSYYWWDGKINRDAEQLMYFKTTAQHYQELEAAIIANHGYDTPEVLLVPVERGFEKYLSWMQRETASGD